MKDIKYLSHTSTSIIIIQISIFIFLLVSLLTYSSFAYPASPIKIISATLYTINNQSVDKTQELQRVCNEIVEGQQKVFGAKTRVSCTVNISEIFSREISVTYFTLPLLVGRYQYNNAEPIDFETDEVLDLSSIPPNVGINNFHKLSKLVDSIRRRLSTKDTTGMLLHDKKNQ